MPTYLHTTISTLLHDRGGIHRDEVDVRFEMPTKSWVESLVRPTINLFLFELEEKLEMRNAAATVARGNGRATTHMPPRRFDLRYLVCAFSSVTEDEHTLLWRALATLLKHPTLPPELVPAESDLRKLDIAIQAKVGRGESEARELDLWGALDLPPRPALIYTVTAPLDLELEFEAPLVLSRTVRYIRPTPDAERNGRGVAATNMRERESVLHQYAPRAGVRVVQRAQPAGKEADQEQLMYRIGGTLYNGQHKPMVGATVGAEGRALNAKSDTQGRIIESQTDEAGRFALSQLPGGHCRLWAKPLDGALVIFDVELPWPFDLDYAQGIALYHITATLHTHNGQPLSSQLVGTADRAVTARTDAHGQFRLVGLPAGRCELFLFPSDDQAHTLGSVDIPSLFDIIVPIDLVA